MNIDNKNNLLLKSSIGENRFSQKNIESTIDDAMVASTNQKSLGMNLSSESEKHDQLKEKEKKKEKLLQKQALEVQKKAYDAKIERDPMKLLRLL